MKTCPVQNCDNRVVAKGFCENHYRRWKRYGDPIAGATSPGAVQKFFRDVVLPYDGDDCLIWPFSTTSAGYAQMIHEGHLKIASRAVCEEVNGPPPTPMHHAAHSCGKGNKGCVSKRHLSWKTPPENIADKVAHGTILRGAEHPNARLTQADIAIIRAQRGRTRQADLAKRFGISRSYVSEIQTGRKWSARTINAG